MFRNKNRRCIKDQTGLWIKWIDFEEYGHTTMSEEALSFNWFTFKFWTWYYRENGFRLSLLMPLETDMAQKINVRQ